MSLGNNTSMGQVRGKNKPILIKRTKEVATARGYTRISGSPAFPSNACGVNTSSGLTEAYYHSGSGALPAVGDYVYTRKRASERYLLQDGHYKTSDGTTHQSFEVRRGQCGRVSPCKS